jgi:hypothetical protein
VGLNDMRKGSEVDKPLLKLICFFLAKCKSKTVFLVQLVIKVKQPIAKQGNVKVTTNWFKMT